MNKEYWLIAKKEGFGEEYKIIDRVTAPNLREAKEAFGRSDFNGYYEVIIVKSEVWLR